MVLAAGTACGFINVIAGSGSLITLPLLIFLGLPATDANGTNRVAILLQNVVSVREYQRAGKLDLSAGLPMLVPAIIGAILGAACAVSLNERLMRLTIAGLMVVMLILLLIDPKRWLESREDRATNRWVQFITLVGVGFYGGFIQAGVGLFLIAALVLTFGMDLVRANALKVLIILGFTAVALPIFIYHGQVNWGVGLLLACGNMTGAWLGTRMAVKKGAPWVRYILIAVVALSGIKLIIDAVI